MPEVAYLSQTGEVKIPLKVRLQIGLQPGHKFDVQVRGRDVVLVPLGLPADEQVREFVTWTRKHPNPGPIRLPPEAGRQAKARKSPRKTAGKRKVKGRRR